MQKRNNKGFMLIETLVVTAFVAGVLIYLYIQFTNLNMAYEETYKYNTVEGLYALEDIKFYMEANTRSNEFIRESMDDSNYIELNDCDFMQYITTESFCKHLFSIENIKTIIITHNSILDDTDFSSYSLGFQNFIKKITPEGKQPYRLIAEFNDSTYATVRFGEYYVK